MKSLDEKICAQRVKETTKPSSPADSRARRGLRDVLHKKHAAHADVYQRLFGFKRGAEWNDGWSEFTTEPVTLCLDGPGKGQAKSEWQGPPALALAVSDIHAAMAECRQRKVKVLIPAKETRVCWMALIADPDGNRICLHQRKDGTAG